MDEFSSADLQARIASAEARGDGNASVGERAGEAKDRLVAFAREHPFATVAGGLVIGLAVASLFKGPRRAARAGGARAAGLAALGSELALALAAQALDKAGEAGRETRAKAGEAGETALQMMRKLGRK